MSNPSKFPAAAKYVIGFVLGTVLLIAAAYLIENWRGDRAWAAEQRRLKEQGLPLTFDELLPPMPPDEENFAMAPIIAPALDITYIDHPDPTKRDTVWNQELKWQRLNDLGASILTAERNGTWRLGRTNDLLQMERSFLKGLKEIGGGTATEDGRTESLEIAFARIEPELEAFETALQRPNAQFPVAYERHFSALLPHAVVLRNLSKLYVVRVELGLTKGDNASVLQDLITGLKLSETLKNEPTLVPCLVRGAMVNQSIHSIWETLRTKALSDDQLSQLQEQLSVVDLLRHVRNSLPGERLTAELFIDECRTYEPLLLDLPDEFPMNLIPRGWLQRTKVIVSRIHEIHARALIDIEGHRYFVEAIPETKRIILKESSFWFDRKVARMFISSLRGLDKAALTQSNVDLARVAVALERYQLRHGRYPESLNRLEPDYLEKVPHDLMTGEPLRYRRENGRFILYSLGLNQVDDGGTVVTQTSGDEPDLEKGDLVWSYFPLTEDTEE